MAPAVRALRGATTVDVDTPEHIEERVVALLDTMLARNEVDHDDLISILFTTTGDLTSAFPATAARTIGLDDVPLMCAQEIPVPGSMTRVIRVLLHLNAPVDFNPQHVYLGETRNLRADLNAAQ